MIFGRFKEAPDFSALERKIERRFSNTDSGYQCDWWIWVFGSSEKVQIDTFTAEVAELKSVDPGSPLAREVVEFLEANYEFERVSPPEMEGHE